MGSHFALVEGETPGQVKKKQDETAKVYHELYGLHEEAREEPKLDPDKGKYVGGLLLHS